MSNHQQLVELYWESCWNARATHRLADVFHDPYTHGRTAFSTTEMALIVEDTVASFPDLQVRVDEKHVDDDIVITRSTFLGTHGGPVFGLRATGTAIELPSLDIFFFRDGKVWR